MHKYAYKYIKNPHLCREASDKYIAHSALTNSKRRESFIEGVYPQYLTHGVGSKVFDCDRNSYIDMTCALGTILFGHANTKIGDVIELMAHAGTSLPLASVYETAFAEIFVGKFPQCEKIRILKSGSEGCAAALRIARAYFDNTKLHVMSDNYHGWHDEFTSLTPPANGVSTQLNISKFSAVSAMSDYTCAVIIEPWPSHMSDATRVRRRLEQIAEYCITTDTLLIFDETITAYRVPGLSVAQMFGIKPDISIQGKALANGLPISVVGGRREVMDADYFVSSTFAGEIITLAVALECMELLNNEYNVDRLWEMAQKFCERLQKVTPFKVTGHFTHGRIEHHNQLDLLLFYQEMLKAGVMFHPKSFFYAMDIHKHIDEIIATAEQVWKRIKNNQVQLEGQPPVDPFAKR